MSELTLNSKIDYIVKTYLSKCSNTTLYSAGKLSPQYYQLRNYIKQTKGFPTHACYDYAKTLTEKKIMSFTDFICKADEYREKCIKEYEEAKAKELFANLPKYKPFSLDDLKDL